MHNAQNVQLRTKHVNLTNNTTSKQGNIAMTQHAATRHQQSITNNTPYSSRYQALGLAKQTFKSFVNDPANKATRNQYGTKTPGLVTLEHFMLWAILRGKDPATCSHDPDGERYAQAMAYFSRLFNWESARNKNELKQILSNCFGDHVTAEDAQVNWVSLLKKA